MGEDLQEPAELLRDLVEIESPTGHTEGVLAVADRVAVAIAPDDVRVEGDHLLAHLGGEGRPLLVLGHTDTVWPLGTLSSMPFRVADGRAYGPGSFDMKGGLAVLAMAIGEARERRPLRVLLTGDEERGSPTARRLIREAADGVAAAFVLEPPTPKGALKTSRRGLRRFRLVVEGRTGDTGSESGGASAIEELAHAVLKLRSLGDRDHGLSINVGVVRGGIGANVVADHAEAEVVVRVADASGSRRLDEALATLEPTVDGTRIRIEEGEGRPPLERSPGTAALFAKAREHGRGLGLDLGEAASGGGSDGNLVGALGIPVLDGLGAEGGGAHARGEHVRLESIPVRARLLARLLEDPGVR